MAQALAALLDRQDLQPIMAYDGEQALTLAQELHPDLILLDIMMPGMSGIEVCARLKTNPDTTDIPIVFLTAQAEEKDRLVGIAAGADGYLHKPFLPNELTAVVEKVLSDQEIDPVLRQTDLSSLPADQLVVLAQEWKRLLDKERAEWRELQKAHRRLEETDHLRAEFLGNVTHELLSPFGAIGLAIQVLQQQSDGFPEPSLQALDDLLSQVARLHRLINGVVKFAQLVGKQQDPEPTLIDLERVVPWAVQPLAIMAQNRDIDFRVLVPSGLHVHADPKLLGEAIFQMAHNAVKFNQPKGQVHVQAYESHQWVVIKVIDTGVGLTPERLDSLGQPFEQSIDALKRGQEGLGIGWAFVCYTAQVHDGWTQVESPGPGQGSSFYLALPKA
jgi:signal transduction histidine kinase